MGIRSGRAQALSELAQDVAVLTNEPDPVPAETQLPHSLLY